MIMKKIMKKILDLQSFRILIVPIAFLISAYFYSIFLSQENKEPFHNKNDTLEAKFDYLAKNGNSSCSPSFMQSISSMPDDARLQGSCCRPMSMHRYKEQIEGLKEFKASFAKNVVDKIPDDPYDIEVGLAKELISYYDLILDPEEQQAYNYAMQNSHEKGPCCCSCWRYYMYGGLAKYLIRNHDFSAEQITELWDLSDGCGGNEHSH